MSNLKQIYSTSISITFVCYKYRENNIKMALMKD